jgi:hypothetical protein
MEATGLSYTIVDKYLDSEFKQEPKGITNEPKIPASERVEKKLGKKVAERCELFAKIQNGCLIGRREWKQFCE